jgi:hypothetical protein
VIFGSVVAGLFVVLNVASAYIATRPPLQARLFKPDKGEEQRPTDAGLDYERVEYGDGLKAWWMPAKRPRAAVVVVHGFNLTDDPIRFPSEPYIPFAADLHEMRVSVLAINLGYANGVHKWTGGRAEAADIGSAVDWVRSKGCDDVVVWGFSAGAHDALVAAAKNDDIAGVVADSAFAHSGEIVKQQSARTVGLPEPFLVLSQPLFRLFGARDVDVASVWRGADEKPVLVIHGDADTAISPSNARRIADATDGELWMVEGADHTDAYNVEKKEYVKRAREFIDRVARRGC